MLLLKSDGCQQTDNNVYLQFQVDTLVQKVALLSIELDSVTTERDQLRGVMTEYADRVTKGSVVHVSFIKENLLRQLPIEEVYSVLDTEVVTYPEGRLIYNAPYPIKGVYPVRQSSSFVIQDRELRLIDPIAFWKYNKYCLILTDSTYSNDSVDSTSNTSVLQN